MEVWFGNKEGLSVRKQIRILRHVRWRACQSGVRTSVGADYRGSPERGVYMARNMLEFETLSLSFKKRNRLAISQFMYFFVITIDAYELWLHNLLRLFPSRNDVESGSTNVLF